MTATTDPADAYRAALAAAGLPDGLTWSVKVTARRATATPAKTRRTLGATIAPGGTAVVFTVPADTDPGKVADAARRMRGKLAVAAEDMRARGVTIVRKQLVNGEGFPFAGTNHRLRLVDDSDTGRRCPCQCSRLTTEHPGVPIVAERGHPTWSGVRTWQLTMRRDAATARTVIEWYREQGRAWLDRHVPDLLRRVYVQPADWPTWEVRPYREGEGYGGTWGTYLPRTHTIRLSWLVFQFPADLLRYVVAHEVAHAAIRGTHGHGRPWQLVVSRLCPDWETLDPRARALPGLCLWAGELDTPPAAPEEFPAWMLADLRELLAGASWSVGSFRPGLFKRGEPVAADVLRVPTRETWSSGARDMARRVLDGIGGHMSTDADGFLFPLGEGPERLRALLGDVPAPVAPFVSAWSTFAGAR